MIDEQDADDVCGKAEPLSSHKFMARVTYQAGRFSGDVLDWDAHIETPPNRPSKTIQASLRRVGRSKPL